MVPLLETTSFSVRHRNPNCWTQISNVKINTAFFLPSNNWIPLTVSFKPSQSFRISCNVNSFNHWLWTLCWSPAIILLKSLNDLPSGGPGHSASWECYLGCMCYREKNASTDDAFMAETFNHHQHMHSSVSPLHLWLCLHIAVPHLLVTTDWKQTTLLGITQLAPPVAKVNQLSQFRGMSPKTTHLKLWRRISSDN